MSRHLPRSKVAQGNLQRVLWAVGRPISSGAPTVGRRLRTWLGP